LSPDLDILDIPLCSIPYILFKLEEIKKNEAISLREHAIKAVWTPMCSHPFSPLKIKSIGNLTIYSKALLATSQT